MEDRKPSTANDQATETPDPLRTPEMLELYGDPDEQSHSTAGWMDDSGRIFATKREAIEYDLRRKAEGRPPEWYV